MIIPRTAQEAREMEKPGCDECGRTDGRDNTHYFTGFTTWLCGPCYEKLRKSGKREELLPWPGRAHE